MAADTEKTVEFVFETHTGSLVTNTTLGTATRKDFPTIGLYAPETTSRAFKSVMIEINWRDAYTTVYNVSGWRIGIKLGATAVNDADFSPTAIGNTGDHEQGVVIRDVTPYFQANFGSSASQTCQVSFAMATATAANVEGITAKIIMTYEYDSTSGSVVVKTVRIPIQSHHTLLTTAMVEIGTTGGTTNAPANQIPALDTFLPETGKNYKQMWFEMWSNDASSATTSCKPDYQIDSGASASRISANQALNTGCYYYDIWQTYYYDGVNAPQTVYSIPTNAVHAFKVSCSPTSRFDTYGGLYCVTYECDRSASIVMNSVILPVDTNPGYVQGTSASNANYMQRTIWISEPSPVAIAQSGILVYEQSPGGATLNLAAGGQTARPYTLTALVNSGGHATMHRVDHSSGWTLARGKNDLQLRTYTSALAAVNSLAGFVYLNYTSGSARGGEKAHNHTTIWFLGGILATGATATTYEIVASSGCPTRTPNITQADYFLNGVGYELSSRNPAATNGISVFAEKLAGEFNGDGWKLLDSWPSTNDGELASYNYVAPALDNFNQDSRHAGQMNIESNRNYRIGYTTAAMPWLRMFLTYHCNTFTVSGSFSSPSGTGAGVMVDIIRANDDAWSGSVVSTASGSYVATVFDDVYGYYASASQDSTHIGRSASALAT